MNKPLPLPQNFLELLVAGSPNQAPSADAVVSDGFMSPGRRNTDLTSSAGFFRRKFAMEADELKTVLLALNVLTERPLPENEVLQIAASIDKYRSAPVFEIDEAHLSKDLAIYLKPRFRHVSEWGWMNFCGSHWQLDKGSKHVQEAAKSFVTMLYESAKLAGEGGNPDRVKAVRSFLSRTKIKNLLDLASSDPEVSHEVADFDAKTDVLNVANGTIKLSADGVSLQRHNPDDLLTRSANVEFDPAAICPAFDGLLSEILDEDVGQFVLRLFGYALTGRADQQTFAIFHGSGANGKSTLTNIVAKVLGDYAIDVEPATFMVQRGTGIRNDLARTNGARLITTSELGVGERLDAPLLKRFVGGDPVSARFLYKEVFTFKPVGVPVIVTNALPIINGADAALARRISLVAFNRVVPAHRRDSKLPERLWKERSGILNRLLSGAADYLQDGRLRHPDCVLQATHDYVTNSDLIGAFLSECCEFGHGLTARAGEVFSAYRLWCIEQNIRTMSQPQFRNELEKQPGLSSIRDSQGRVWQGLRLRDVQF